jgi:hypothetical protein
VTAWRPAGMCLQQQSQRQRCWHKQQLSLDPACLQRQQPPHLHQHR